MSKLPSVSRLRQPRLSLVSDDYGRAGRFGRLHVVAAPEESPPFAVDAVAVEEDTHLLLSADAEIREPTESLAALTEAVRTTPPNTPGNVLVRKAKPLQLLAIVHDIEREPTWSEAWIASAMHAVFEEAEWRRLRSVALPLLGTRHGDVAPSLVARWAGNCLLRGHLRHLRRLWIVCRQGAEADVMHAFRDGFASRNQSST